MNKDLLKKICNTPGIPGHEGPAQEVVKATLSKCCDEVKTDHLGNVIALKKADSKPSGAKRPLKVVLAAHVDEIGMMVKHINDNGMIHFIQLGGLNPQVCESQRIIIHGRKPVRGVIVPKSGENKAKLDELLIDTGMEKEKLEKLVEVGDIATFEGDVSILNGKMWVGRNFDDRIGTYCLVEAMRKVKKTKADIYAVSSVQEEVGLRGMRPASHGIAPDIGLAIDGSMTRGAYVAPHNNLCEPGKGTGIYLVDNLTIGHLGLLKFLYKVCEKNKIPFQKNIGGGTDARAIQQSGSGVVTTTIGAPVRYMHSTVQLCHSDDMDATVDLLVKFMENVHKFPIGDL